MGVLLWGGEHGIWIGIDDTDSVAGGCTTFLGLQIITALQRHGYQLIGYPRLVRLNPNIPWKTRGNGAVSFQIGIGQGIPFQVGQLVGQQLWAYSKSKADVSPTEYAGVFSLIRALVEVLAYTEDEHTNPGVVIIAEQPSSKLYTKAVQQVVTLDETYDLLKQHQALFSSMKNNRGLIGAAAGIAWQPEDVTYECITYRQQNQWGTPRKINSSSVQTMDAQTQHTFDNYDYQNKHDRITPSSPCPVLFGIRADEPEELKKAKDMIAGEPYNAWLLYQSNQGTDDHLTQTTINKVIPYDSVQITGKVGTIPTTKRGGHVFFCLEDETGRIDCAAYEPTKQFRTIIRQLYPGDLVSVCGGIREQPLTVNLEKIQVQQLVTIEEKLENPVCKQCGKHMKSKGKDQGYKCVNCGTTADQPITQSIQRMIKNGWYEVPVCARRHLSKPLKRMNQ